MALLRVLLGFATASDHVVEETTLSVLNPDKGMYSSQGAAIYTTPPVSKSQLDTGLTTFTKAMGAQAQGGSQATAAKDTARLGLVGSLRQLALYAQITIQANPDYGMAELLLSGFDAVSTNRAQKPLGKATISGIENSGEGQLTVHLDAIRDARMYQVQKRVQGTTEFDEGMMFNSTRGMTVHGLTPGALYEFRVRALGGSTGFGEWSDVVSHRSL